MGLAKDSFRFRLHKSGGCETGSSVMQVDACLKFNEQQSNILSDFGPGARKLLRVAHCFTANVTTGQTFPGALNKGTGFLFASKRHRSFPLEIEIVGPREIYTEREGLTAALNEASVTAGA